VTSFPGFIIRRSGVGQHKVLLANFFGRAGAPVLANSWAMEKCCHHFSTRHGSSSLLLSSLFRGCEGVGDSEHRYDESFIMRTLSMMPSPALKVGDVVYGVGGSFNKRLGKVTKVNPSKPAVEDSKGQRSCYWEENLFRVGEFKSRFGYCSSCNKPSQIDKPCPFGAPGGRGCRGIVRGNLNWKLQSLGVPRREASAERGGNASMGIFLAKQLGASLARLGISDLSAEILEAVRSGMREVSITPRVSIAELPSVSPSPSLGKQGSLEA
jgi:hypothetical protein